MLAAVWEALADNALSEADAHDLAASINSFTDTFALDEWVFRQPLFIKRKICQFPLCFNSPRPAQRVSGGNPPAYCNGRDQAGYPHTAAWRAKRLRGKLREQRGNHEAEAVTDGSDEASRPVTAARSAIAASVATIEQGLGKLAGEFRQLREAAERSTDATLVEAEIEAIQHQAREGIERESRLRAEAEKAAREAANQVARMMADVEETDAAFEQLEARAAQDRADREAAQTALAETEQTAREEIAAVRRQSQEEVAEAQAAFTATLAERSQDMAHQIAAANRARDSAAADAEARERAAAVEVAAAAQRADDAIAARDELKAHADSLMEANTALREAALRREREFEVAIAARLSEHEQDRAALHAIIDELRAKLDQLREEHDAAMALERNRHEEILAARLREAADNADKLLAAEMSRLAMHIKLLQARLDVAEQR